MSFQPQDPYNNPFQSPQYPPHHGKPTAKGGTPAVWVFYVIYCIYLSLIYAALIALGAIFIFFAEPIAESDRDATDPMAFVIMGIFFCGLGLPFFVASVAGPLVPKNRFGWIYGIVLIAIGLTSGCTIMFSIPLLIFWLINKDLKQFYRME